jgi:AcrR family transcriptional regulator
MGKGEATRVAVLSEATRLASQVGLGGLTIGSLATQTGLSKSGLFAHFQAKESLQVQVLEHAAAQFRDYVVAPALKVPRGEPRLRALFDRWLSWISDGLPGGCLFISASNEFDDQPGPVRDVLFANQRDWMEALRRVVGGAVTEGHLAADTDTGQFAQDLYGIVLAYSLTCRLLRDPEAEARARRAFETLLRAAR